MWRFNEDSLIHCAQKCVTVSTAATNGYIKNQKSFASLAEHYVIMDDELYQDLLRYCQHGTLPSSFTSTKSNFLASAAKYAVMNGQLQRNGKWVVQKSERDDIFKALHMHSGRSKTWFRVRQRWHFFSQGIKYGIPLVILWDTGGMAEKNSFENGCKNALRVLIRTPGPGNLPLRHCSQ